MAFAAILGPLKFLVTRPLIIPAGTIAAGCVYGFFDVTKQTGRIIFETGTSTTGSYIGSVGVFGSTLYLRNLTSPHDTNVLELIQKNEFKKLLTKSRGMIIYNGKSLAAAGAFAGLAYAYLSEPLKGERKT